ncbi:MAG: hypothetical protein ACOY3I_01930, partial [Verrucomicrobiota bacterium]
RFPLLQYPYDLLFSKSLLLHMSSVLYPEDSLFNRSSLSGAGHHPREKDDFRAEPIIEKVIYRDVKFRLYGTPCANPN